jgi:hypothetical protein
MGKPLNRSGGRARLNRSIHNAPFHLRRTKMSEVAPAHRQYVIVNIGERRYTYHNDADPLAIGDQVQMETPKGGRIKGEVSQLLDAQPPFPTRAATKLPPTPESEMESAGG